MTDTQLHAAQIKSLRTVRKYVRSLRTYLTKMDNTLDRLIASKNVIRSGTLLKIVTMNDIFQDMVRATTQAMTDTGSTSVVV